ncbi:MAG: hypothetical protein KGL39_34305 [Patescibacteria group bacterium]|nr:hypothetical protein [Patescibacteria group bacterium]
MRVLGWMFVWVCYASVGAAGAIMYAADIPTPWWVHFIGGILMYFGIGNAYRVCNEWFAKL